MLPPQDALRTVGGPGWDGAETTPSSSSGADSALGGRRRDQWAQCEHAPLSPAGPGAASTLALKMNVGAQCWVFVGCIFWNPLPLPVGH